MSPNLITQLEQVARSQRRRRWLAATCWALVAVSVSVLVLIGLDRMLGIADLVGRTLLTTTLVVVCVLIARRWSEAVCHDPVTPLQIAAAVERRCPNLRDVVTSAWDFSQHRGDDPALGSASLRRAVVIRAATAVDQVDWQQLVSRQPLRKSAAAVLGVLVTIGLLAWQLPQATRSGLLRLVNPLNSVEWPRQHDLQFVETPARLAAHQDLVLQLRDTRGTLPPLVTMHYRTRRQGGWHEETQVVASGSDALQVLRPHVQQSLQYRATGGDHHTMPWQSLEVVAAPRVDALQLTVHPPAYTHLPAQAWDKPAPIYAGSDLELAGRTDQPLRRVVLHGRYGAELEAQVSPDGHSFRVEPQAWRITASDTFVLDLTTASGLLVRSATQLALEVLADQPPQVRFIEPTRDLTVLPTVAVPLTIEASDEGAIRDIALLVRRSDRSDQGEQRVLLWAATDDATREHVTRWQRVDYLWQLAPLALEPGSVVEVHAQATDNRPLQGRPLPVQTVPGQPATAQPGTGQTVRALRLKVVTSEALARQLLAQQAELVETLARLLQAQQELRDKSAAWAEWPAWSAPRWTNASHAALFGQRQISAALATGEQSVIEQLAELGRTIQRNNLLRPEVADRSQTAQELLQDLVDVPLVALEQSLTEVARQSQRTIDRETLRPWFAVTAEQQGQVVAGLRRAVNLLMPGNLIGRLESELVAIQTGQAALLQHCQIDVAPQLLQAQDNPPAVKQALAAALRRQRELGGRLAQLLLDLAQAAERFAADEPTLATRLTAAVALAEELGLQATMRAAAAELALRRTGRAASWQRQTVDDLTKLLAQLAGQEGESAADRLMRLRATERELQQLRRQLATHQEQLRQLTSALDPRPLAHLHLQRQGLALQTEEIARQLRRLRVSAAAAAARQAASQLRHAGLGSESTRQAQQQLGEAQQQLAAAQQQLAAERLRQQVVLARLQLAQLDSRIGDFVGRQQAIQQAIAYLEQQRTELGRLGDVQQQRVQGWADRQAELRREVASQADQLGALPVFGHLLRLAAETMQHVEKSLQRTELGQPTQDAIERAIRRLTQLAAAVRQERRDLAAGNRGEGGGGQAGDTARAERLQLVLGQLELLKSLQTALREQTQILETQPALGQPPADLGNQLARQQQQLAELALRLAAEPADPPAEKLFPNLEQGFERPFKDLTLPRSTPGNQP